jgi:hypothetical protein
MHEVFKRRRHKGILSSLAMYAAVAVASLVLCSCATTKSTRKYEPKVDWQEALDKAEDLAPKYGYDLDYMNIEIILDITPWDNRFPGLPYFKQPRYQKIKEKLAGRHFWAVNCLPTYPRYGGSFCVFVDAETGEVIHVFTGW